MANIIRGRKLGRGPIKKVYPYIKVRTPKHLPDKWIALTAEGKRAFGKKSFDFLNRYDKLPKQQISENVYRVEMGKGRFIVVKEGQNLLHELEGLERLYREHEKLKPAECYTLRKLNIYFATPRLLAMEYLSKPTMDDLIEFRLDDKEFSKIQLNNRERFMKTYKYSWNELKNSYDVLEARLKTIAKTSGISLDLLYHNIIVDNYNPKTRKFTIALAAGTGYL